MPRPYMQGTEVTMKYATLKNQNIGASITHNKALGLRIARPGVFEIVRYVGRRAVLTPPSDRLGRIITIDINEIEIHDSEEQAHALYFARIYLHLEQQQAANSAAEQAALPASLRAVGQADGGEQCGDPGERAAHHSQWR